MMNIPKARDDHVIMNIFLVGIAMKMKIQHSIVSPKYTHYGAIF